jgi:hypothetical protein
MIKFLQIYLGFFVILPVAFCLVVYSLGCFLSWSILVVDIQWWVVRLFLILSIIFALFLSIDE